jgi:xanthine/CO dehydrogenase XdhC/CoxF family maturation factor
MTHELKSIFQDYLLNKELGKRSVLATVVALDGSSYRRPGVRMLIREDGKMTGAVSGGCVEKEVVRQAASVFADGSPKMMTYDGRYRLGCEGVLYILIEAFEPSMKLVKTFKDTILSRKNFTLKSYFKNEFGNHKGLGTVFNLNGNTFELQEGRELDQDNKVFEQELKPCFKLVIIGGEHDAVRLSQLALNMGWEVTVSTVPNEDKTIEDFPGIIELWNVEPSELPVNMIDSETALVLMTHSYVKDLKYLLALKDTKPAYFGLLGPSKRREKLFGEFMELYPEVEIGFFERIHGPAGLNIGAETPEEIAVAILSEILAVVREQEPMSLKDKTTGIHH